MKLLTLFVHIVLIAASNKVIAVETAVETRVTPAAALKRLLDGNLRFVEDRLTHPDRNEDRRLAIANQQKPFAILLGCSDSRVPPEIIFDLGLGDVFVIRVAGNVVAATELDSIEYSAIYNDSSIIVVLGHENCGAVTAVLNENTADIPTVASIIQPSIPFIKNMPGNPLENAIKANIRRMEMILKRSPVIEKLRKEGKLEVVGAYYHLKSGRVDLL